MSRISIDLTITPTQEEMAEGFGGPVHIVVEGDTSAEKAESVLEAVQNVVATIGQED